MGRRCSGEASRHARLDHAHVKRPGRSNDARGASFTVVFDPHTGAPTIDVARSARLTVDGTASANAVWSGDGQAGHHRSGTLRFDATGPARATARLTISGLDAPLTMTWQLSP